MADACDEEPSEYSKKVKRLLDGQQFSQLRELCCDNCNLEEIKENGWDIFTQLMSYLKEKKVDNKDLKFFEDIFSHISKTTKAKEIFLGILEQFDPMVDMILVELLFPALTICCKTLLISDKRNHCHNLSTAFSTLLYYVEGLNLPKYNGFEPLENAEVLEETKIARFVGHCVALAVCLLSEIFRQHSDKEIHENHLQAVKLEFMNFCSGLLERISYLELDELQPRSNSDKSLYGDCAKQPELMQPNTVKEGERMSVQTAYKLCSLLRMLHQPWLLVCDLTWKGLHRSDRKLTEEECDRIELARATYLYLTLLKQPENQYFPQIIHPEFLFVRSISSILMFWKKVDSPPLVHKGLELCRFVTNRLEPLTLRCGHLSHCLTSTRVQDPAHRMLTLAIQVATRCSSRTLRQRAVQFLYRFLDKFVWRDRQVLLYFLLTTTDHSGVVGYLIVYYKDKLARILQENVPADCRFFVEENNLSKMLDVCLMLRDGSETDLLLEYDRLMSSLNLLRFLFIRDSSNQTTIWSRSEAVRKNFLEPLRTGINLSRMHFRDELERQLKPNKDEPQRPDFFINGVNLPTLPLKDRKQALKSAIHSFDMMQEVCIRVQQLIDDKNFAQNNMQKQ